MILIGFSGNAALTELIVKNTAALSSNILMNCVGLVIIRNIECTWIHFTPRLSQQSKS